MRYQGLSTIACTVLSLAGGASAKILWDPVGDTCKDFARSVGQPDLDSAVKKLWGDIENMATYAHDMMDKAESGSISDPWKRLRILGTYDVFFNGQHSDSQQRWNSVKCKFPVKRGRISN